MINRFNNLTSKEWLPFQKSWFKYTNDEALYRENIRFFIKFDDPEKAPNLFFYGDDTQIKIIKNLQKELKFNLFVKSDLEKISDLQFALIDLRSFIPKNSDLDLYLKHKKEILDISYSLKNKLQHRRFLSIFSYNLFNKENYYPIAWDLAKTLASTYSLKDEKIACLNSEKRNTNSDIFQTSENIFYSLYFRNDEKSNNEYNYIDFPFFGNNMQNEKQNSFKQIFDSWFILKPKPRNKNEILHPAKYPEELTKMFIKTFTKENDNVFDPMSGTGSTQLSAIQENRNAYGTELSNFFANIANDRCNNYVKNNSSKVAYKILNKDARKITKRNFPEIDYIITSP
ncbi:MAG: DNA methyltransferase, partial [Bacteroidota bacterium]|nr:DNA methyltransferase [Bacteroidota bacterium]